MNLTCYKRVIFRKIWKEKIILLKKTYLLKDLLEYSSPKTCKNLEIPACFALTSGLHTPLKQTNYFVEDTIPKKTNQPVWR